MPNLRLNKLLIPFELIYRIGFFIITRLKRWRGNKGPYSFFIISVGNITVGGTGKSVVVPFIANMLGVERCAIVLRGYKGTLEHTGKATVVSDGSQIYITRQEAGDEALMYAQSMQSVVVVSKDRARACDLIQRTFPSITYVILDDAYQNFAVQKNREILLLDARAPFDNGHCLPIGRLREKDIARASLIVLTHADQVTEQERVRIIKLLKARGAVGAILYGAHRPGGIFFHNNALFAPEKLANKKFLLAAGVGSFSGVVHTAQQAGATIIAERNFADHYEYAPSDVDTLLAVMQQQGCNAILVTSKDWVKLEPLVQPEMPFYILRVAFEFLSAAEYDTLSNALKT